MSRRAIIVRELPRAGPYAHAVWAGNVLICSGQTPFDPSTRALVEGTVVDETRQCLANLNQVLEEAGLTSANVVSVQVFLTNMADFEAMNDAYAEAFAEPHPARTTVGVAQLPLGARVEVALTAYRPD